MKNMTRTLALFASLASSFTFASSFPVEIQSCNQTVTFDEAPSAAVFNDVNIVEYALALDLQDSMAGITGVDQRISLIQEFQQQAQGVPSLSKKYPSTEVVLGAGADIFVAGWNYGFKQNGDVTPEKLAQFGIKHYAIAESCAHVMTRDKASIEDMYTDLLNIGKIFGVAEKAEALIAQYKSELASIESDQAEVPVFVYDSGEEAPFTAGRLGMPTAIIEAAGGKNIMDTVEANWTKINWEAVIEKNPEHIVIVDYGTPNAAGKIAFLKAHPALQDISAIKHNRFTVLPYAAATPGVRNIAAIQLLAKDLQASK